MPGQAVADPGSGAMPSWVPEAALRYLAHTEKGHSIRSLARSSGCHASTVLRQIRRLENLRDDFLVDEALRGLGRIAFRRLDARPVQEEPPAMEVELLETEDETALPDTETFRREARRVLRRLCEPGAVLAVAADMDKAVVVRDTPDGTTDRLAVLDRVVAQALALKDWIVCSTPGRVSRYSISAAGRNELQRLLVSQAHGSPQAHGMAEAPARFDHGGDGMGGDQPCDHAHRPSDTGTNDDEQDGAAAGRRRIRYSAADTPVAMLARRRDRDGNSFLEDALVRAAERLADDFELSQMEPRQAQNWDRFLTAGAPKSQAGRGHDCGAAAARKRVENALRDLGPGLGDVVLRCCCYQQGLEIAEKRLGWSARSGKIVLRIALQRLRRHYQELGDSGGLIG